MSDLVPSQSNLCPQGRNLSFYKTETGFLPQAALLKPNNVSNVKQTKKAKSQQYLNVCGGILNLTCENEHFNYCGV